jgi:protein TonB
LRDSKKPVAQAPSDTIPHAAKARFCAPQFLKNTSKQAALTSVTFYVPAPLWSGLGPVSKEKKLWSVLLIFHLQGNRISRTPWMGLAIALQLAGAWLFMHGLATGTVRLGSPIIELAPQQPEVLPRTPPPPEPKLTRVEVPQVPRIDDFRVPQQQTDGGITVTLNTPPATTNPPVPKGIDRPAASVAGTHTVPPYPIVARRAGAEGVVTLRLTVGTDGHVSAAEIVTSAGRDDLDQAARDWILAHWRYRPALKDGSPALAQLLASVTYSLKNER